MKMATRSSSRVLRTIPVILVAAAPAAVVLVLAPTVTYGSSTMYEVTASSYIGGSGADDSVRGCAIQSDGTVVLAANIGDAAPGGLTPILLSSATSSSPGAVVRLSPDGRTVLSVTRLADLVLDLAVDENDNVYVALWSEGVIKLNSTATSVIWSKSPGSVARIE